MASPLLRLSPALVSVVLLTAGCASDAARELIQVDALGSVSGLVFVDRNGNGQMDAGLDVPASRVAVSLLLQGSTRAAKTAASAADGGFLFPSVPVGRYRLSVDTLLLGDSVRMQGAEPTEIMVSSGDTTTALVVLARKLLPVAAARARVGQRVAVEGIALNGWGTFADSSLYLSDRKSAVRILGVPPTTVGGGDSVRVLGLVQLREGQPAIVDPLVFSLGRATLPAPLPLTAGSAARAGEGELDASLVQVVGTTVLEVTAMSPTQSRIVLSDASGRVELLAPAGASSGGDVPLVPGVVVDAVGVLSPAGNGVWRLRARAASDLTSRIRSVTAAEARRLPPGQLVALLGIALNGWATFGNSTVHLADPTGSMRVLQIPASFLFAGDSVRIVGTVGSSSGQPVLLALPTVAPSVRSRATVPPPLPLSTAVAAGANQGTLDAALVQVRGATVAENLVVTGGRALVVNDGSGPLQLQVDLATGIAGAVYAVGTTLDAAGLLVPNADGSAWILKPRSRDDIVVR